MCDVCLLWYVVNIGFLSSPQLAFLVAHILDWFGVERQQPASVRVGFSMWLQIGYTSVSSSTTIALVTFESGVDNKMAQQTFPIWIGFRTELLK